MSHAPLPSDAGAAAPSTVSVGRPRGIEAPLRVAAAALGAAALLATLSGCSVLAAPCRISAAVVKTVPVAGKVVAVPLDACADIID